MSGRHGDRGTRDERRRRSVASHITSPQVGSDPSKFHHDPVFGDVRLIPFTFTDAAGKERQLWQFDPDYEPFLPKGAVRGDVRKQEFCPMCWVPKYFYTDCTKTCVQCDESFVFAAKEQKFWYETLKFNFSSVAIRCHRCRKTRRSEKALRAEIAEAKAGLARDPGDLMYLINVAAALVRYHQKTGQGNLDEAVAAARKALKKEPRASEAIFWEGLAHFEAGRRDKARSLLERFTNIGGKHNRLGTLLKQAKEALASL